MSSNGDAGLSLSQQDKRRLEASYKTLAELQRKTLAFLNALCAYETRQEGNRSDTRASRMAFVVTPLMVNHYNYMHRVYRASLYGNVPDLCDQTGGIMCTDLNALREELADRTADVVGANADTYRSATLPNVLFDFKNCRDNVLESAVRLLDSVDIKQPDLTHGIRNDYVQNVRAIQESLTNALQKSKEGSEELRSRLEEVTRKLRAAEKTMAASVPDEAERLRKEVFELKDRVILLQHELSKQRFEEDTRTLELKNCREECKLLRGIIDRLKAAGEQDSVAVQSLRDELFPYVEAELRKLKNGFGEVREQLRAHVESAVARSNAEKQDALDLCRALLDKNADRSEREEFGARYLDLQRKYNEGETHNGRLQVENSNLKRELQDLRLRVEEIGAQHLSQRQTHDRRRLETPQRSQTENDDGTMDYEGGADAAQTYVRLEEQRLRDTYLRRDDRFAVETEEPQRCSTLEADLEMLYTFLTDTENVDVAKKLVYYVSKYGIRVNHERLAHHLLAVLGSGDPASNGGELEAYRAYANGLGGVVEYSNAVFTELVAEMDTAYRSLADSLGLQEHAPEVVTPENLTNYFTRRFGEPLRNGIAVRLEERGAAAASNRTVRERDAENEKRPPSSETDALLVTFDGDPTLFQEVVQKIWLRSDTDPVKRLLNAAYYALALDRITRYETSTAEAELKLYNVVEYTVLTERIKKNTVAEPETRPELENPDLNNESYFLRHFIKQLGNAQVEYYVNGLDLCTRNKLALILFQDYYVPVVNKRAYVISIDGPFANFNMVYKTF